MFFNHTIYLISYSSCSAVRFLLGNIKVSVVRVLALIRCFLTFNLAQRPSHFLLSFFKLERMSFCSGSETYLTSRLLMPNCFYSGSISVACFVIGDSRACPVIFCASMFCIGIAKISINTKNTIKRWRFACPRTGPIALFKFWGTAAAVATALQAHLVFLMRLNHCSSCFDGSRTTEIGYMSTNILGLVIDVLPKAARDKFQMLILKFSSLC